MECGEIIITAKYCKPMRPGGRAVDRASKVGSGIKFNWRGQMRDFIRGKPIGKGHRNMKNDNLFCDRRRGVEALAL